MFIITHITSWLTKRDGKNRIGLLDAKFSGGRTYMLNGNRIKSQREFGSYTQFEFYDALGSSRESPSVVVCSASMAQLSTAINTDFTSKFVTLPFYKNNNPAMPQETIVIPFASIAYADRLSGDGTKTWVIYYLNDFKRMERLCAYSMEDIGDLGGIVYPPSSITWDSITISFDSVTVTFDAA